MQHGSSFPLRSPLALALAAAAVGIPALAAHGPGSDVIRVSVAGDGQEAHGASNSPALSGNGRFVAFVSSAADLVPDDHNRQPDVFVHDAVQRTTVRASVGADGVEGAGGSSSPSISAGGRFVAFVSDAANLVSGDRNGHTDVFVRDLHTGHTVRASVDSAGAEGDGDSFSPSLSANGRWVAFLSEAELAGDGEGGGPLLHEGFDLYVRDLHRGETRRVNVSSDGEEGNGDNLRPAISGNGQVLAWESDAQDLVPGDTNGVWDVFVHHLVSGVTERVSVASDGTESDDHCTDPAISGEGGVVAFVSAADNLVPGDANGVADVFVRDLGKGTTERVSVAWDGGETDGSSFAPSLSWNGRWVAFESFATNLVPGDTNAVGDVFLHDRWTGKTTRLSVGPDGAQADAASHGPSLDGPGHRAAFASDADDLVTGDGNGASDVFLEH